MQHTANTLPAIKRPEVIKQAIKHYGTQAQVDMAIEEMSELTKALLKERRAAHYIGTQAAKKARNGIFGEMADVTIMLMQLLLIFDGRDIVQEVVDEKIERLAGRLDAAQEAGAGAAQDVMQPAT